MEETKPMPWELAAAEGKTIIGRVFGPMIGVYYPYRKSGDLYVVIEGSPIHCCQCEDDLADDGVCFWEHIQKHNKHRRKYPGVIVGKDLVKEKEDA